MRNALILAPALLLAACTVAPTEHQAYLRSFLGQPEDAVVRQFGPPSRTQEIDGMRILAYVENAPASTRTVPVPAFSPHGRIRISDTAALYCETSFEVAAGKVARVRTRGTTCG